MDWLFDWRDARTGQFAGPAWLKSFLGEDALSYAYFVSLDSTDDYESRFPDESIH